MTNFELILTLMAGNPTGVLDYIESGARSTKLQGLETTGTMVYQDTYTLFMKIGIYGALIMLICGFIALMMPSNGSQERAQAKKKIELILVGVFLLCLAVTIISWVYGASVDAHS